MTRDWADLSGPALNAALTPDSIVLLPTGAVEHHGAHLPLRTDLLIADLMSQKIVDAAVETGLDVWRLPPLAFTKSNEHHWAPGTVWLGWETLMNTVLAIGRSVAN